MVSLIRKKALRSATKWVFVTEAIVTLLIVTGIAGVGGTGIGGLVGALLQKDSNKAVSLLLSFAGGIMLGVIEQFAKAYVSTLWSDAIVFGVLVVVLIVKPTGLLGKKISEKV